LRIGTIRGIENRPRLKRADHLPARSLQSGGGFPVWHPDWGAGLLLRREDILNWLALHGGEEAVA